MAKPQPNGPPKPNIFGLLKPYRGFVGLLILTALLSNGLNLLLPRMISSGIDAYTHGTIVLSPLVLKFFLAALGVFAFAAVQTILQTYASERAARDLREKLAAKISRQSHTYIQAANPSKLLTNLTADIDSIKIFVSQVVATIVSSIFLIVGASVLLLLTNWKLALGVLILLPIIGGTFSVVFGKVRVLFIKGREVLDRLNKVINESILGSTLIRVLNAQDTEYQKFVGANSEAKQLGLKILSMFATMIPTITFVANFASIVILVLGGHLILNGSMSLGQYAAFMTYFVILIFPIFMLGFMSSLMAQATASYQRVSDVLEASEEEVKGTLKHPLRGEITVEHMNLSFGEKPALKDVSFTIKPGTRTAIIGPTAAGKTQLLYLMMGLGKPTSGRILYDGQPLESYDREDLHMQVGFVFQDSILFNLSVRENVAFNQQVTDEAMRKAMETAELQDFISGLPEGMETIVSERGTSLSGGQKQRIMLARALALNPKILLLDDFTARVDTRTEQSILNNLEKNYPGLTLVSVTQKIGSVEHYDQIIVLMEGEVLATGTHAELMHTCPEYVQIFNSQQSTSAYELHA